jgi:membrane protease YdiL (CAAX protease family)
MDEQNNTQKKARRGLSKKMILLINALAILIAVICFVVIAIWIPRKGPFFDAPLRSFLTGLGLLGLACPPFTVGFIFQKKAANSPYFEEGFIRTGFFIVGFVCLIVGLICVGLSVYALIMRMFGEQKKSSLIFSMSLKASNLKYLCLNSVGYLGTILKATSFPM